MSDGESRLVLIIEDEPDMVRGLRDTLTFEGFRVSSAGAGAEGVALFRKQRPQLVFLDLMLPDMNGYRVCEEIRRLDPKVPLIMLTARGQESDKIRGLEAGADDYVTKPFSIGELLARIGAILRRASGDGGAKPLPVRLRMGGATVDLQKQKVTRGRESQGLSFYESEILKLLYEHKEEPVSRDEILERIWGADAASTTRTVDNFIVKLRRKLEKDHKTPKHILTVYGIGYKLVP